MTSCRSLARETPRPRSRLDGREPDFQAGYVVGVSDGLEAAADCVRATGEALADEIAMAYLDAPATRRSRSQRGGEAVALRDVIVDVVAALADELDARALMNYADPVVTRSAWAAASTEAFGVQSGRATGRGYPHPPGGGGRHTFALRGYLWVPTTLICCLFWLCLSTRKAST